MATAFFIGDLILKNLENAQERLVFLGADQLGGGRWRVHLSREILALQMNLAVPMHMDVIYGQTVRMPRYGIHWNHDGKPAKNGGPLYGVSAIRFLTVANDSVELEYEFPAQR